MNKITIDKIASQAMDEIQFARTFRQPKVNNWQRNEEMYYSKKMKTSDSRANVSLGRMQEFVHTLLSKIDNPLHFKFVKRKTSQLKRVERLNALKKHDQNKNNWDIKDLVGKKQAIIYGRAVYSYFAESENGYKAHLEPVDVYDFLIDPTCGGIDIEEAYYMGSYNVALDRKALKEGVKNKIYNKEQVKMLLDGTGNEDQSTQEKNNKRVREYSQGTVNKKEIGNGDKFKFWRWFTTFEGERYYLLIDNSGGWIRCDKLTEMFTPTDEFPQGAYPFWTWAAFPDLTEFWTPSYCDYAREIFMAQDVSINQMLDNAEMINKPMRAVNTSFVKNLAELRYRKDGIIKIKGDVDINRAYQAIQTPSIDTPLKVFDKLEAIQQKSSGVTDGTAGVAEEDGKVGIYEGNQTATADRFGLLNKSYAFGYKRFAKLYEIGVGDHLIKKVAIEILGPNGVEVVEVKRSDIYRKKENFGVIVEASNSEEINSIQDKKIKLTFLDSLVNSDLVNQKKVFEMKANIVGLSKEDVDELMDTTNFGNQEIMSECDRDLEELLDSTIKPNQVANNAYKQRMVDYLRDKQENITMAQFERISAYIDALEPIIMRNEARNLQVEQVQKMKTSTAQTTNLLNNIAPQSGALKE